MGEGCVHTKFSWVKGGKVQPGLVLWGLKTQIKTQNSIAIGIWDARDHLDSNLNPYLHCCRFCLLSYMDFCCVIIRWLPLFSHTFLLPYSCSSPHLVSIIDSFLTSFHLFSLWFAPFNHVKFNSVFPYLKTTFSSHPQLLKLRIPNPGTLQNTESKLQILSLAIHLWRLISDNI